MADQPLFKALKRAQIPGVFSDYVPDDATPNFLRFNLIYGFNGTGKSTLSRIFRCLSSDKDADLPDGGSFQMELTDSSILSSSTDNASVSEKISVFNDDFVEANFRWKMGDASPVAFFGAQSTSLSLTVERVEEYREVARTRKESAAEQQKQTQEKFTLFKRNVGRQVAEALNLGRSYTGTNVATDYANGLSGATELSSETYLAKKKIANQVEQQATLQKVALDRKNLEELFSNASEICKFSLAASTLEDVAEHMLMVPWIDQGLKYHTDKHLNNCLFCGGELTQSRLDSIEASIDERLEKHETHLQTAVENTSAARSSMESLQLAVPSPAELSADLQAVFQTQTSDLEANIGDLKGYLDLTLSRLGEKRTSPHRSLVAFSDTERSAITQLLDETDKQIALINALIENHNDQVEKFSTTKKLAADDVKGHLLLGERTEYAQLSDAAASADAELERRETLYARSAEAVESLRAKLRNHGAAAEAINPLVSAYLGHNQLELRTAELGYQIIRAGMPLTQPPSEGEKTAFALCYFLVKLREQDRKISDSIVVLDDPVSSLDTRSVGHALSLIQANTETASQVFILTHHLHFMNEVKKWLRPKYKKQPPEAGFFFIETLQDPTTGHRRSRLRKLPKLLRSADSEYLYLVSIVLEYLDSDPRHDFQFLYLLPNAMRKVLELFLEFKLPKMNFTDKMSHEIVTGSGLSNAELSALTRLVHLESHSDDLSRLIEWSTPTIEEIERSAVALMLLIEKLDPDHYARLRK